MILFESDLLIVLNKPSGLASAPLPKDPEGPSALTELLRERPELRSVPGHSPHEPALLHRLDTGTSGLLLVAKTAQAFVKLSQLWKLNQVKKFYRARVTHPQEFVFPRFPHRIDWDLAHHPKSQKKMIALEPDLPLRRRTLRGKPYPAITHILDKNTVLGNDTTSDLSVQIETGVMHQIRCHLSFFGTPILGDTLYRGQPAERLYLHAWRIEIPAIALKLECPVEWAPKT